MEPIVILTGATIAAVIAAGAYLRWGLVPVFIAYRVGRRAGQERLLDGISAAELAVILAAVNQEHG